MALDIWGGVEGTIITTKSSSKAGDFEGCVTTAIDRAKDSLELWTVMQSDDGRKASKEIKNWNWKELKKVDDDGDDTVRVSFYWANSYKHVSPRVIKKRDVATVIQAQINALQSILDGLSAKDEQGKPTPKLDLTDDLIKLLYASAKEQRKPKKVTGREKFAREPRLQTIEDGGESYWSDTKHTWIKGTMVNKVYTSPAPNQ